MNVAVKLSVHCALNENIRLLSVPNIWYRLRSDAFRRNTPNLSYYSN